MSLGHLHHLQTLAHPTGPRPTSSLTGTAPCSGSAWPREAFSCLSSCSIWATHSHTSTSLLIFFLLEQNSFAPSNHCYLSAFFSTSYAFFLLTKPHWHSSPREYFISLHTAPMSAIILHLMRIFLQVGILWGQGLLSSSYLTLLSCKIHVWDCKSILMYTSWIFIVEYI